MDAIKEKLKEANILSTAMVFYFVVGVAVVNLSLVFSLVFTSTLREEVLGATTTSQVSHAVAILSPEPTITPTPLPVGSGNVNIVLQVLHQSSVISIGVDKSGKQQSIDLSSPGMKVQIEDLHNSFLLDAKDEQAGMNVALNQSVLANINTILHSMDVQVGTNSNQELSLNQGDVKAQTQLPLTVDIADHVIDVNTAKGPQAMNVLPQVAVKHLEDNGFISSVINQSGSGNTIDLVDQNGDPTFVVDGVSNKKVFGIFPVSIQKTLFVSATTGDITDTGESVTDKMIEELSF